VRAELELSSEQALNRQRLRPERGATSPRESDPSTKLRVDLRLSKV
jgi:hypothetical protein